MLLIRFQKSIYYTGSSGLKNKDRTEPHKNIFLFRINNNNDNDDDEKNCD